MTRGRHLLHAIFPGMFWPPQPPGRDAQAPRYARVLSDLQRDHEQVIDGHDVPPGDRSARLCELAERRLAECLLDEACLRRLRRAYGIRAEGCR